MNSALVLVRVALAAVFTAAAMGKLAHRSAAHEAVLRFGVPARLARTVGLVLPPVELVIAAGLLIPVSAAGAALAAGLLLVAFCVAMLRLLARGEAPECHCFGTVGSKVVGARSLARNLLLLAGAGFVAVAGRHGGGWSLTAWIAHAGVLACVAALGFATHAAFSWQLFRQNGRLLDRVEALETVAQAPRGARSGGTAARGLLAPSFALPDLDGRLSTLDELLAAGNGALLFFTDPGCSHCDPLLPVLAARQHEPPLVVISRGAAEANRAKAGRHGLSPILLQDDFEVADAYGAHGLPAAVLIDPAGKIASGIVAGADAILALADMTASTDLDLIQLKGAA